MDASSEVIMPIDSTAECAEGPRWSKTVSKLLRSSAVIFLARKYRIAIGRPISDTEVVTLGV